jgi:hypothetical protein
MKFVEATKFVNESQAAILFFAVLAFFNFALSKDYQRKGVTQ